MTYKSPWYREGTYHYLPAYYCVKCHHIVLKFEDKPAPDHCPVCKKAHDNYEDPPQHHIFNQISLWSRDQ